MIYIYFAEWLLDSLSTFINYKSSNVQLSNMIALNFILPKIH